MLRPFVPVVLLTLFLTGCGAQACPNVPVTEPGAYVRGRVTDAAQALEAAQISFTDTTGAPVSGVMHARTDAAGEYLAGQIPADTAFVVEARGTNAAGQTTILKTLTHAGTDPNAFTDLSAATTILTSFLTRGRTGMPGNFDATVYAKAVDIVGQKLAGTTPPSLTNTSEMANWLEDRAAQDQALRSALDTLRGQVAAGPPREAVETQVRAANPDPDPLDALKPVY